MKNLGISLIAMLALASLGGCATFKGTLARTFDWERERTEPPKEPIWPVAGGCNDDQCRNERANDLLSEIDENFMKFRDKLRDPKHGRYQRARDRGAAFTLLGISVATGLISNKVGDETDEGDRKDLTNLLTTISALAALIQGWQAILDNDERPSPDDLATQMENNRREVLDCINQFRGKPIDDYSYEDMVTDMRRYFYAGTVRLAKFPEAMAVSC
ncbi:MAG: hypothetical protein F4Y86_05165 [Gammaproteobacteria bacterium]|nr:hypothetical protein [Gammaproteobacteria bacterium]